MPLTFNKGLVPENRGLTKHERDLVLWLIDHGAAGADRYKSQIDAVAVTAKCNCGCPTVYFESDGMPSTRRGETIISDFMARMNGEDYGVTLFVNEGYLSSLEVYSCAGHDKPFGLPALESLYSYEEAAKRTEPSDGKVESK